MTKRFVLGFVFAFMAFCLFAETIPSVDEKSLSENDLIDAAIAEMREKEWPEKTDFIKSVFDIVKDSVYNLEKGTDGTFGAEGSYVLFGLWPQTIKPDFVTVDASEEKEVKINSWICHPGSDGCYYVYKKATPDSESKDLVFSNGKPIENGQGYYFLLEPIKWRIIDNNYQNGKLLMAENILEVMPFNMSKKSRGGIFHKIFANNYQYCTLRAWLNGFEGFENKAFSSIAIDKLNSVNLDNGRDTTGYKDDDLKKIDKYVCKNTEDKVFLLSGSEIGSSDYGFDNKLARVRTTTDYSKAMGAYSDKNEGNWWVRSPDFHKGYFSRFVSNNKLEGSAVNEANIGIVPAVCVSQSNIAPDFVSNLNIVLNEHKLSFSWLNPEDDDFEKVIISGVKDKDIVIDGFPDDVSGWSFSDLKADSVYNISLKTVDSRNNINENLHFSIHTDSEPEVNLYETPVMMPKYFTNGSAGYGGDYVLFGVWPNSVKDEDVIIDVSKNKKINNWDCYAGSDGFYYVRSYVNPNDYNYKFANGIGIEKGYVHYFKLEPIKWRILTDDYQGGKLLLCENVIANNCFYTNDNNRSFDGDTFYPADYEYSTLRAYLNGIDGSNYFVDNFAGNGFIDKAFTKETVEKIITVAVNNSDEASSEYQSTEESDDSEYDYYYDDFYDFDDSDAEGSSDESSVKITNDKIFLLSENEVTRSDYGFCLSEEKDPARRIKTTDYSRAVGAYSELNVDYPGNSWWWLRSPVYGNNYSAYYVDIDGDASRNSHTGKFSGGIVPALVMAF